MKAQSSKSSFYTTVFASVVLAVFVSSALSACGNDWVSANARKSTPSAMMLDAQLAYDDQNYTKSAAIYEKVVAADPENAEARTRLAFAYNAKAGLGVFDLVGKMLTYSKASGASGDSSGGIGSFSEIVGLTAQEKVSLFAALNGKFKASAAGADRLNLAITSLADLKNAAPKLQFLHNTFSRVCKLLPKRILDKVIRESDSAEVSYSKLFELDTACNGGVPEGGPSNSGANFAAAIGALANAAILYQVGLDPDGDGKINLADDSTALTAKLTSIQSEISAAPNTLAGLSLVSTKVKELNTNTAALVDLGKELSGEVLSATAIYFNLLTLLIAEVPGIPSNVKTSIDSAIGKFTTAKAALAGFVSASSPLAKNANGDAPTANPDASKGLTESSTKASDSLDSAYTKQLAIINDSGNGLTPAEKAQKQEQLTKDYNSACDNFEALRKVYNRPDATKPANCPT